MSTTVTFIEWTTVTVVFFSQPLKEMKKVLEWERGVREILIMHTEALESRRYRMEKFM